MLLQSSKQLRVRLNAELFSQLYPPGRLARKPRVLYNSINTLFREQKGTNMLCYIKSLEKQGEDFSSNKLRQKCGELCGSVGIGLNILLFAAKLIVALASGSAAVLADAVNNLSDAASSVVALLGFKLSKKRPDPEHPFGHGRVEYIAGFVISIVIILMGFELGSNALSSLIEARSAAFTYPALAVLTASVLVKLYMAGYLI